MANAICLICSNEEIGDVIFPSMPELIAHQRGGHKNMPKVQKKEAPPPAQVAPAVVTPAPPSKVRKPIVLVYKYEGTCPDCDGRLDTINVDLKNHKLMVIAYCPFCKKQFTQKEVVPIDQQIPAGRTKN